MGIADENVVLIARNKSRHLNSLLFLLSYLIAKAVPEQGYVASFLSNPSS